MREVAAFLLDQSAGGHAGVPPTALAELAHPSLNYGDAGGKREKRGGGVEISGMDGGSIGTSGHQGSSAVSSLLRASASVSAAAFRAKDRVRAVRGGSSSSNNNNSNSNSNSSGGGVAGTGHGHSDGVDGSGSSGSNALGDSLAGVESKVRGGSLVPQASLGGLRLSSALPPATAAAAAPATKDTGARIAATTAPPTTTTMSPSRTTTRIEGGASGKAAAVAAAAPAGLTEEMEEAPALPPKLGSLQLFVQHDDVAGDLSPSMFSVDAVHRIALFDIRICNCDRNEANILVRR